ncbi:MAG: SurA N-terminal domain-containing protein [Rickettsiales bacterium]
MGANLRNGLLVLGLLLASATMAQAARVGIAAVVNDDAITSGDVADRRDLVMTMNNLPPTPENVEKVSARALQALIEEQLELQEAKRQSQVVSDDELEKALSTMSATRGGAPGSLRQSVRDKNLSIHSLENQLRAQLAWNKVVQHKLRRNVSISQDEIARAQLAVATGPGTSEIRIAAFLVPIADPSKAAQASKFADEIVQQLKQGISAIQVANDVATQKLAQFNPPSWLAEETLSPQLQQAVHALKPGEITPPLRSATSIQIVQLLDRQIVKMPPENTEIALKQIAINVPDARDKEALVKLQNSVATLQKNPGNCTDEVLAPTPIKAEVKYARTKVGLLSPQQRAIIGHLDVGDVSDPIFAPQSVQLVLLCEKIEPAGNLPDAETVRQQLYTEKLELEAQKLLRDLKRDAFIDIKTDDKS